MRILKQFKIPIILFLFFIFIFIVENFTEFTNQELLYIKGAVKFVFILVIAILIIKFKYAIFNSNVKWRILYLFIGILILFISLYSKNNSEILLRFKIEFLIYCLITASFEELLFRVFTFNILLKCYSVINSSFINAIIFGFIHIINMFYVQDKLSIFNQMFFAFGIGFFLQALYIMLKDVSVPITLHTIINFYGAYEGHFSEFNSTTEEFNMISFLVSLLIILFINAILLILGGLLLMKHKTNLNM